MKMIKIAFGLVFAGVLIAPARAVTISSSVNGIVFQDDFENDTLGAFPTLSGSDVGLSYTMLGLDVENSHVEDDSTATGPLQEARPGKYLNIRHVDDAAANGKVTLDFGTESGSTLTASFFANITEPGIGASLRVGFKNGVTYEWHCRLVYNELRQKTCDASFVEGFVEIQRTLLGVALSSRYRLLAMNAFS